MLVNGSLVGSVLMMDVVLKNVVLVGVFLFEVSWMFSFVFVCLLGLEDWGELWVGKCVDLVVFNDDLEV